MAHTKDNKTKLLARVRRLAGQVGAIERALESNAGCAEVLQQAAAVRGAVNGFIDELVEDHLREHVAHPDLSPADRAAGADELIAVIRRYSK
jgi:FrmR/RcnR family transcriptional regulator, repressor of frmRAB operon